MVKIKEIPVTGYEKVIEVADAESNLHAFIAIHSTKLGPALGGTRFYPYNNPDDALKDVLRLSKAMSYKSAVVQDGLGGGKSVIIGDPKKDKNPLLMGKFAEVLNSLNGKYIAAEDVGTNVEDMLVLRRDSPYVAALPTLRSSGDPSRFTAWGVYRGLIAIAKTLWNKPSLKGKQILIQGLGNVGSKLAQILFWEGAELILCDTDPVKLEQHIHDLGAKKCDPSDFSSIECDIFAPCALGGIINEETIPQLKFLAIGGSANNQLQTPEMGIALYERGILYAPDYIINAGGIINASAEFDKQGYNPKNARDKTAKIETTLLDIFERSKLEHKATNLVADELAEFNIKNGVGQRLEPILFER